MRVVRECKSIQRIIYYPSPEPGVIDEIPPEMSKSGVEILSFDKLIERGKCAGGISQNINVFYWFIIKMLLHII